MSKSLWVPFVIIGASLALACGGGQREAEGPAERAGERVDEAAEETGEAAEEAGEETGEAIEEAGENVQDAAD